MVTALANKVAHKPMQRRCPKSVLFALTYDYLTALVILATTFTIRVAVLPLLWGTVTSGYK